MDAFIFWKRATLFAGGPAHPHPGTPEERSARILARGGLNSSQRGLLAWSGRKPALRERDHDQASLLACSRMTTDMIERGLDHANVDVRAE